VSPSFNKNNLFISACKRGHLDIVKQLLQDQDINPFDQTNAAIRWAVYRQHIEVLKELLSAGLNCIDALLEALKQHHSMKWEESQEKSLEVLEIILSDSHCNPSDNNNSAFDFCLKNNQQEIIELLFNHPKFDLTTLTEDALIKACSTGNLKALKMLLNKTNLTPPSLCLYNAIHSYSDKYLEMIRFLLKDGRINLDLARVRAPANTFERERFKNIIKLLCTSERAFSNFSEDAIAEVHRVVSHKPSDNLESSFNLGFSLMLLPSINPLPRLAQPVNGNSSPESSQKI
jgi:hypothetical protein